jgi:hypothetical protein
MPKKHELTISSVDSVTISRLGPPERPKEQIVVGLCSRGTGKFVISHYIDDMRIRTAIVTKAGFTVLKDSRKRGLLISRKKGGCRA